MALRRLTYTEIETLASRPGVRRIAVENFLCSFPTDLEPMYQNMNLHDDARAYGWNTQTVQAIKEGLRLAETAAR